MARPVSYLGTHPAMFANATQFAAIDFPTVDATGRDVLLVVVKATFEVKKDGRLVIPDEPAPIRPADVLTDPENPLGSIKYPSDLGQETGGTDVIVVGDAVSPKPVTVLDVGVKVRDTLVPLRVHGERFFCKDIAGVTIGPAAPFTRTPITYERAYGGATEDWSLVESRNWAGVGVAKRTADLVDRPAPQIEHPARPHTSARDKHPPVGYGPIMSHWSPRAEYAGTFDAAWEATRMPLLPKDFDRRYYSAAHPSLFFEKPLAPGDRVSILGMSQDVLAFELPRVPLAIRARFDVTGRTTERPYFDTVIVEPGKRRVELVARKSFRVGRAVDVLREVAVQLDEAP